MNVTSVGNKNTWEKDYFSMTGPDKKFDYDEETDKVSSWCEGELESEKSGFRWLTLFNKTDIASIEEQRIISNTKCVQQMCPEGDFTIDQRICILQMLGSKWVRS